MTVQEVVEKLNDNFLISDNINCYFVYLNTNYTEAIELYINTENYTVKIDFWNNENDDRKFIESKNEYEDLEKFIIKKFKTIIKDLKRLSINL